MVNHLVYDADKGKLYRDKIVIDLTEAMGGLPRIGVDLRVTRNLNVVPLGEKEEIRLKGKLEQAASGFAFHDLSDEVLPRDCHPVDVILNPKVRKVEMFFYPLAG